MDLLAYSLPVPGYLTDTVALAAVALIGYLFGHRTRCMVAPAADEKLHVELNRAVRISKELQLVADHIRVEVAAHQASIARFQSRLGTVQQRESEQAWNTLTDEAEALLGPTIKLATNLSAAYDQLRQHSTQLMNFAELRIDPQTGVGNRRAMEEHLETQLAAYETNKNRFSLALFQVEGSSDIDSQPGPYVEVLCSFAELLENTARDSDFVARYSDDEFVVLMSHTTLAGAAVFSERLLRQVDAELECIAGGGIVEVQPGDTSEKLLSRADSALYSARSNGHSCIYLHNGKSLRLLQHDESSRGSAEAAECEVSCGSTTAGHDSWND